VTDLQFAVDVFAVTKSGNHLFQIANIDTDQVRGSVIIQCYNVALSIYINLLYTVATKYIGTLEPFVDIPYFFSNKLTFQIKLWSSLGCTTFGQDNCRQTLLQTNVAFNEFAAPFFGLFGPLFSSKLL
jgi:hypothetical protein